MCGETVPVSATLCVLHAHLKTQERLDPVLSVLTTVKLRRLQWHLGGRAALTLGLCTWVRVLLLP